MGFLDGLFEKKIEIYKKRDKETWTKIKDVLKEAGIKASASHYDQDTVMTGPGAPIDPRDYAGKKRIDRDIYVIAVPASKEQEARDAIRAAGLTTIVDPDVLKDAYKRHPAV